MTRCSQTSEAYRGLTLLNVPTVWIAIRCRYTADLRRSPDAGVQIGRYAAGFRRLSQSAVAERVIATH